MPRLRPRIPSDHRSPWGRRCLWWFNWWDANEMQVLRADDRSRKLTFHKDWGGWDA